jgi:hypothetical protein
MPYTYHVDHQHNELRVVAEGVVTLADIRAHLLYEEKALMLSYRELIDARRAIVGFFGPASARNRAYAAHPCAKARFGPDGRGGDKRNVLRHHADDSDACGRRMHHPAVSRYGRGRAVAAQLDYIVSGRELRAAAQRRIKHESSGPWMTSKIGEGRLRQN